MDYLQEMMQIEKEIKAELGNIKKELKVLPKGKLSVYKDGSHVKVYKLIKEGSAWARKGIKRKEQQVAQLYKKEFLLEKRIRLETNNRLIESTVAKMKDSSDDSVLRSLPKSFVLLPVKLRTIKDNKTIHPVFDNSVEPRIYTPWVAENEFPLFAEMPYRANNFNTDELKQRNPEGISFRSKSEMNIYELYKKLGCAVHYDELLQIGNNYKSPDFLVLRKDGKLILHEHCGLVENEEYMQRHNVKIEFYRKQGIVPWDNLIITYEKPGGGVDLKLIEAQIQAALRN